MKRTLLLLSGLLILMVWLLPAGGLSSQAQAADDPNVTIILQVGQPNSSVNGVDQEIDPGMGTAPVIVNGRTFVPIRSIIESMGGTISWNGQEQKVSISLNNNIIELTIGSLQASVNGDTKTLEAAPFISSTGRTMLPLRFITENLGSEVAWDGPTQTITIEYGPDNITPPPAAVETADFSGTWDMVVNDEDMGDMKLVLTQDGTAVSGYFGYDSESGKAFAGTVAGNTLSGKFSTTNPVSEWEFTVTMAADGNSFDGTEYYSSPAWAVHGAKSTAPAVTEADFSGTWDMVVNDEDMGDMKLVLTQDGTAVSGYFGYDSESGKAFAGTVAGNTLSGKFSTTNPVSEWEFTVTMAADGNSFTGMEYYSSPAWAVSGVRN